MKLARSYLKNLTLFLFLRHPSHRRPFAQPARQEPGRFEGEVEGAQMQMQMLDEGSVVDQLRDRQVDPQCCREWFAEADRR